MQINRGRAEQPFSGSTNITKTFTNPCTSFVISNDGASDLTITINGASWVIKGGEVFDEDFAPFKQVAIVTAVPYRAYVRR
jgi:hypothetical protein